MQHHGAPTRFLDWSDGGLVALHFALREKRRDDTKDAVVYVLESYQVLKEIKAIPARQTAVEGVRKEAPMLSARC